MGTNVRALTRERESAILDAGRKRFARFGLGKVTMEEIASDVGLGKASLYYYFPAKEDLFRAVIEREEKEFVAALKSILERSEDPAGKLKLFAAKRLELFGNLLNLSQFRPESWTALKPAFQRIFQAMQREEQRFLVTILNEGIANGAFAMESPERVATTILRVLQGLRLRVIQTWHSPDQSAANYAELGKEVGDFLDLVLSGIQKRNGRGSAKRSSPRILTKKQLPSQPTTDGDGSIHRTK